MNSWQQPVSGEPSLGTIHETPDSDRSAIWDINGVTDAGWTDRDFSAYCPTGVKMLYLRWLIDWTGDGAYDYATATLRKNGSAETDADRLYYLLSGDVNAPAASARAMGYVWVECDEDGIIESQVDGASGARAAARLYLHFMDYII